MQGNGQHVLPKRIKNFCIENVEFLITFENLDQTLLLVFCFYLFY